MKASRLTRVLLAGLILAGMAASIALIGWGHYAWGLVLAAAVLAVSMTSHYFYAIKPISTIIASLSPQLEELGFEAVDTVQLKRVGAMLDETVTLCERPVEVLQAAGARRGEVSVIWVQYVTRKNLQMGFAWIVGFPGIFRGPGRLFPKSKGEHRPDFEDMFRADKRAINNLMGEMTLPVQQQLVANPYFVYEFDGPTMLADFILDYTVASPARVEYFDHAGKAFMDLLETIQTHGAGMFENHVQNTAQVEFEKITASKMR